MKCPNCTAEMEGEDSPFFHGVPSVPPHPPEKPTPSKHYRCDGCDSEWVWTKNQRIRNLDTARVISEFERAMREETIPAIVKAVEGRARAAHRSRYQFMRSL